MEKMSKHAIERFRIIRTYSQIVDFKPNQRVLDIGCYDGAFLEGFRELGLVVTGIDIDERGLNLCKEKKIECHKVNLEKGKFPFKNDSFDILHCHHVIEHIVNAEKMIKESNRVLKKGGKFIIVTPNWTYGYRTFFDSSTHIHPYSAKAIKELLSWNGFRTIYLGPKLGKYTFLNLPNWLKYKLSKNKCMLCIAQKIS